MSLLLLFNQSAGGGGAALSRTVGTRVATSGTTVTSGSMVIPDNSLVVLVTKGMRDAAEISPLTVSNSGAPATWTQQVVTPSQADQYSQRIWFHTAYFTTGGTFTFSATCASAPPGGFSAFSLLPIVYQNASPTVGVSGSANNGPTDGPWSPSLSGAPAASSDLLAAFAATVFNFADIFHTDGAGVTRLDTGNLTGVYGSSVSVRTGSTAASYTWNDVLAPTSTDTIYLNSIFAALEIKQASGGVVITCAVGAAAAAGVSAQISATLATSVGAAAAAGVSARVSATLAAAVGAAAAVGVSAQVSAMLATAVAAASATGTSASISTTGSTVITCAVGAAAAAGVSAQVSATLVTAVAAASAAGVGASINVASSTVITCAVGSAAAAGVSAQVSATLVTAVAAASATGASAGISTPGTTVITCAVGAAAAVGVAGQISATIRPGVGAATAAGVSVATGLRLAASLGDGTATGVLAQLQFSVSTAAGAASALGVPFIPRSSNDILPGALVGNRPYVDTTRPAQQGAARPMPQGAERPMQQGAARPPRIARTTR